MIITALKTPKITAESGSIYEVLDGSLPAIMERTIVVITSKIVSICEGSTRSFAEADKEQLVIAESDIYLPASYSRYGHHFTIKNNTLISVAGIDESNGQGHYVLWPRDAQKTANDIRAYLANKHGLTELGVIITDSTCQPLRRGTTGIALAHSGFAGLRNYIGKPDLFDRPFGVTQANISGGLAAAAVLAMGEGSEQTPLCILTDLPTIEFQTHDPIPTELQETTISLEEDLFAPFLTAVTWKYGKGGQADTEYISYI